MSGPPLLTGLLAERRPPGLAVARRGSHTLTFARFRADVAHNARRLAQAGYRCGAPVSTDTYWFTVGVFALLRAGADVAIPPSGQPAAVAGIEEAADAIVTDDPTLGADVFVLEPGTDDPGPLGALDEVRTIGFHTSGSTGTPKMAARPLAAYQAEIAVLDAALPPSPPGALVSATVPHQHLYGMTFRVLLPLMRALPFSCATQGFWEDLLTELAPGGVLVTSPAHLTRLSGLVPLAEEVRPALVLSAGAPLPMEAAREATATLGVAVTELFGSTETGSIAMRRADGGDLPWRPLPGVELRAGAGRHLSVKSAHVGRDGWMETADLADVLPDGGFRFRGRSDRIVKVEGKRLSLGEVERALIALPEVAEAAVALVPGSSVRLAAAVVLTAQGERQRAMLGNFRFGRALCRALARNVDPMGLPRRWRFVAALPTASLGKRRAADIAALFSNRAAGEPR